MLAKLILSVSVPQTGHRSAPLSSSSFCWPNLIVCSHSTLRKTLLMNGFRRLADSIICQGHPGDVLSLLPVPLQPI